MAARARAARIAVTQASDFCLINGILALPIGLWRSGGAPALNVQCRCT